jgi:uncharacterized protein YqgC (DUF456 family)
MTGLIVLVGLAMAAGLVGTVLPVFPGLPVIWAAALVYGIAGDFSAVGWACFAIITVLFVGGMALGLKLPHRRAVLAGAPKSTIRFGILGAIVGFFVIPVVGLPVGAAAGVLLAERRRRSDWSSAWATTKELLVGFGLGMLAEVAAGTLMIAVWVAWVLLD